MELVSWQWNYQLVEWGFDIALSVWSTLGLAPLRRHAALLCLETHKNIGSPRIHKTYFSSSKVVDTWCSLPLFMYLLIYDSFWKCFLKVFISFFEGSHPQSKIWKLSLISPAHFALIFRYLSGAASLQQSAGQSSGVLHCTLSKQLLGLALC